MSDEVLAPPPALLAHDRLLVLAPHPDDETLGAGGTIAAARRRGIPVRIVFLTNGDGSRSTQIALNLRRMRRHSFRHIAALRQQEATAAALALGVDAQHLIFLGYPDGGTRELWLRHHEPDSPYRSPFTGADRVPYDNARTPHAPYCRAQVLADFAGVLREFQPTLVVTTHPRDTHADHQAAYQIAVAALAELRRAPGENWAADAKLLTFLVHHGLWPVPYGYRPDASLAPPAALRDSGTTWQRAPLDTAARHAKKTALEAYVSQLATTPNYLRSFLRRDELFGVVLPERSG